MTPAEPKSVCQTLLACVDFSDAGQSALWEALCLAAERPTATLHVVHVAGSFGPLLQLDLPDGVRNVTTDEAARFFESHVEASRVEAMKAGDPIEAERVKTHLRVGGASEEIVALARDLNADLVVVGTHGRSGVKRLLLGSVAESVVAHGACSTLVVRPKAWPPAGAGGG